MINWTGNGIVGADAHMHAMRAPTEIFGMFQGILTENGGPPRPDFQTDKKRARKLGAFQPVEKESMVWQIAQRGVVC